VRVDMHVCDARVRQPTVSVDRDVPGVSEDDEPPQAVGGSCVPALAPMPSDSVEDHEPASVDENADAVAVGDTHSRVGGVPREGLSDGGYFVLHAEGSSPCACPRAGSRRCRGPLVLPTCYRKTPLTCHFAAKRVRG